MQMKNNHEIILKQYAAYCKEQPLYLGTAGSYGMEMLTIIREGVWAEYDILAAFHPPVGAAVQVRVGANNQIGVPIEATAEKGMGEIVFAGYKEGVRQIAVDVLYKVAPSSGASGTEPAEPAPDVVQQILSAANGAVKTADGVREDMDKVLEAESGRETAEANRAAAESARVEAESARVEAETARAEAEAYRAAAEKERQTAESARLAAENDRQSAETARAKAETARESAETDRATAEVARVNAEEERADYEKLRKDHEAQRVTDETVRQTAESKRQEAETARADAESKRADAEQARVKAESTRVAAETTRKDAESKRASAEQERQTAEKGRVAAEAKRTEDFAKIKARLDEIPKIDDTAITTTSLWSSKQIVDTLCPPIEETGNPVVCYPVAGYPLGVKAKWEPVQEGSGTPSPENIRPIKGRDSVRVERCGENLLNPKKNDNMTYKPYGLTITYIGDNKVHLKGIYSTEGGSFVILDTKQKLIAGKNLKITGFTIEGTKQTYTLYGLRTKDETVIAMQAQFAEGDVIDMTIAIVVSQNTPSTYTPYIEQTNTLTLPETVYGGEVDAVSGEVAETWGLVTLDGAEKWTVEGKFLDNKTDWYYVSSKIPNAVNAAPQKSNEICSHYPHADIANTNTVQGCAIVWGCIRVRWGDTIPDDADAWKAYLAAQYAAGTPVQIAYKLAEPVPFTAAGAQPIPALAGANTVLTDADSVSVSGRADLIHIIKTQEK